MTSSSLLLLLAIISTLQLLVTADDGYFYDKPTTASNTGHKFAPLPTIVPLPAVPLLPGLPTPRSHTQTQTLLQVHPPAAPKSIAAAYLPPRASQSSYFPTAPARIQQQPQQRQPAVSQITQLYRPAQQQQQQQQHQQQQQQQRPGIDLRFGAPPTGIYTSNGFYNAPSGPTGGPFSPTANFIRSPQPPQAGLTGPSAPSAPSGPSGPSGYSQTPSQPLRIPFGKAAIISPGTATSGNAFYTSNDGRQLKQYAVVEIIDNDIEQMMQPFLSRSNVFDSYRATSPNGGVQLNSRANILVQQQQQQQQIPVAAPGDAVALGSGGLGYIRLANGNVYLGSGSLGYISGQQRSASLREARTRMGAPVPDALHFGHGALGGAPRRFK